MLKMVRNIYSTAPIIIIMNLNIVALIPARSGSKGIPDKNIKLYKGLPLFVHSINIAKKK